MAVALSSESSTVNGVARHRTAMSRTALSRPLTLALQDGLISEGRSVFDYGCGRGGDVMRLRALGIACDGWDPAYFPSSERVAADVVNLGYVVNVIEHPEERLSALTGAWDLARVVLVVAARMHWEANFLRSNGTLHDGLLTARSTFQRLFTQEELRDWLSTTLGVQPIAAAPGVFYAFKSEEQAQAFLARRYRRLPLAAPRPQISRALFEAHRPLLDALMNFLSERGRLPEDDEMVEAPDIRQQFGSMARAFSVVRSVTDGDHWRHVQDERRQDLLVYLGLARFGRRPILSHLPLSIQRDVKAFFGTYRKACEEADELLFSAGKRAVVDRAAEVTPVGKITPDGIYVHTSALSALPAVLRVYEGCARTLSGEVEAANIIKLNRLKPKVSYLSYPDFDRDPHPALAMVTGASLPELRVDFRDFRGSSNPPILHRKETFVGEDYPLREKFARLTQQEERYGLYEVPHGIGTRNGWLETLAGKRVALAGHRVIRCKSLD